MTCRELKKEFDAWGGSFIFFFDPATASGSFNPEEIKGMPGKAFSHLTRT